MAMNTDAMNEIFRNSVNMAQECAKKTKDEGQKGLIYATLALAMASAGSVALDLSEAAKAAPEPETTREDLKPKASKKFNKKKVEEDAPAETEEETPVEDEAPAEDKAPAEEPEVEEETSAEEKGEEKVFGAEWTEEALEHFAKETQFVEDHQGRLYEAFKAQAIEEGKSEEEADKEAQEATISFVNDEIESASSGVCHTTDDINPMNIEYIVGYMQAIERGEDPAPQEYAPF